MNITKEDIVRWIRQETGAGLFECQSTLDNLVDMLKKKPYIMDNPYILVMEWKINTRANESKT